MMRYINKTGNINTITLEVRYIVRDEKGSVIGIGGGSVATALMNAEECLTYDEALRLERELLKEDK